MTAPKIAFLGLGEAGSTLATDLAPVATVTGYDPLWTGTPDGFVVAESAHAAVSGADIVIALTAVPDAEGALESVVDVLTPSTVYVDMSSSSPAAEQKLAARAAERGVPFADAVLLDPVLKARLLTPIAVAGPGAARFTELLTPLGLDIALLPGEAGQAAARKLLRSIVIKGLTALLVESLRAAENEDLLEWFSTHIAEALSTMTPQFISGLLDGTTKHSVRRVHEMEAAVEMIVAAGGQPFMTRATVDVLRTAPDGIPRGKALA